MSTRSRRLRAEKIALNRLPSVPACPPPAQLEFLQIASQRIVADDAPYRLIIMDSAISNLRADYLGRGTLADRQQARQGDLDLCELAKTYVCDTHAGALAISVFRW